eukprot:XP_019926444.1 PREDICTED: uncharacterized protein LOC109619818 [Crassostrea gigas]
MDPHDSAHDVHRCDLCETAIPHSYCDFCHVNLCNSCIAEHISDDYEKHKMVSFQQQETTLIYPKCEVHPHKSCELQCNDCSIFVCTSCVGSKQHKGHDFWELEDIFKTKKDNIKKDAEELQNIISPTYEEMAQDLENQIVNLDEGYEKLTVEISKQGEEWHREIDVVITKMKKKISEIKVKHKDILHKHLNEIKQIQSLILQDLKATQEIEESNEASIVIEYNSENREFSKSPTEFKVSLPTFIPKPIDREKLYSLFGKITLLSTAIEQNVLLPKMPPNTSATKLLDEPKLDVKIQILQSMLSNVSYVDDEKIWISGETGEIKCFNIKGLLLYTVWTKSGEFPTDIAVDGNGDLLFSDWRTKSVYTSKNWQTEELIRLEEWTPCQLCVTSTGDILVTMYSDDISQSKVVRYSGSTEKQTIQFDEEGKPLFSGNSINKYIRENRNHDICVADYGASAVVVVNQDGELRWRYTGHSPTSKNKNFYPCGITTDSQSRILTADGENHCIHILDQDGEFLRYIDNCDLNDPWGLSVDNSDNLFVCEYESGNLKKIKYLK